MKVLVLYGTTEGHTHRIADFVAGRLKTRGDSVTVVEASEAPWDLEPSEFEAVVVAASLHDGSFQPAVVAFVGKHHDALNRLPSAFLSVSLSAAGLDPEDLKNAQICVDMFRRETGWTGGETHHVGGALRFSSYDFFKRWMMKMIARERGLKVAGVQELELTDWEALGRTVDAFRDGART